MEGINLNFTEEQDKEVNNNIVNIFKEEFQKELDNIELNFVDDIEGVEPDTLEEKITADRAEGYLNEENIGSKFSDAKNGTEAYMRFIANMCAKHIKGKITNNSIDVAFNDMNFEIFEEKVPQPNSPNMEMTEPHKPIDLNDSFVENEEDYVIVEYLFIKASIKINNNN